jgi:hypothetical protein
MWNEPTKERLARIPRLYETENTDLKDKEIHLHFFIGSADWYIAEYDGDDLFWGYAHLGDDQCAEWGYVSFSELRSIKVQGWLEVDCEIEEVWQVRKASEIDKIRIAHGWLKKNGAPRECSKQQELIMKIKAGHFHHFQDLFAEVTSPYSDFFGIDPYPIWEAAHGYKTT